MTRQELINRSEACIRQMLRANLPPQAHVYLYDSRARRDNRWNSDYDLWIDADISRRTLAELNEQIEESFVPFKVDIVTTAQLKGHFAERIRQEATPWM